MRFDIREGDRVDHYRVAVHRGTVAVDHTDGKADCVVTTTREVFDRIAGGHLNALPAALRGLVELEGDPSLLIRFQRLFPAAEDRATPASSRTVGRQRS
jgi:putative sterol carrier protein